MNRRQVLTGIGAALVAPVVAPLVPVPSVSKAGLLVEAAPTNYLLNTALAFSVAHVGNGWHRHVMRKGDFIHSYYEKGDLRYAEQIERA